MKKYGLLRNPVTGGIAFVLLTLSVCGLLVCALGHFTGIIPIVIALFVGLTGFRKATVEPYKIWLITLWGKPIIIEGEDTTVDGDVFLADFFPLYIGAKEIEMTLKKISFEIDMVSRDEVPVRAKVAIDALPDRVHLSVFAKAGGWEKIEKDLWGIVNREGERFGQTIDAVDMASNSSLLSNQLETARASGSFQEDLLGITILRIQVDIELPQALKDRMIDAAGAVYQSTTRQRTTEGLAKAAQDLVNRASLGGQKIAYRDAYAQVIQAAMLEDGKIVRAQIESIGSQGGQAAAINVANIHLPNIDGGGSGNQNKNRKQQP